MVEHSINELKAATIRQLKTQQPDADFELIAKYVYARLAELNPDMKALPEGEYYANAEKGLRSFFVTKGKIRNFKEEGTLKPFIDEHLGLSSYINNNDFAYFYFAQFADLLNSLKTEVHFNTFNKQAESNIVLNEPYQQIFEELFPHLNRCINKYQNYFQNTNILERGELSFLFDTLHFRKRIKYYEENLRVEFESIKDIYINNKKNDSRFFILYSIVFIGLYSLDKNFNERWKNYRESEIRTYDALVELSRRFRDLLESKIRFHKINDKQVHGIFIYLLKYMLPTCKDMLKRKRKTDKANKANNESEQLELSTLFLSHMLGGDVTIKKSWICLHLDKKLEFIEHVKSFMDSDAYRNKIKSDNIKTQKQYKEEALYISRNNNKYKKDARTIQHLIYSFFTRAIEYYGKSEDNKNLSKWKLFKLLFSYLPDDFIHGTIFNIDGRGYNRQDFLDNKRYNNIHSEDDIANVNCYREYFKSKREPQKESKKKSRYYKRNFIDVFAEYNYVSLTFEGDPWKITHEEAWDVNLEKYKALIIKDIENYCDSILSNRQPETPNSSH